MNIYCRNCGKLLTKVQHANKIEYISAADTKESKEPVIIVYCKQCKEEKCIKIT